MSLYSDYQWKKLPPGKAIRIPGAISESVTELEPENDVEQAREDGYAAGFAEGETAGQASWAERLDQLQQLIGSVEQERHQLKRQAVESSLHMLETLFAAMLPAELGYQSELFPHLEQSLLAQVAEETVGRAVILLNPADAEHLSEPLIEKLTCEIETDASIPAGTLRLQQGLFLAELDLSANVRAIIEQTMNIGDLDNVLEPIDTDG